MSLLFSFMLEEKGIDLEIQIGQKPAFFLLVCLLGVWGGRRGAVHTEYVFPELLRK